MGTLGLFSSPIDKFIKAAAKGRMNEVRQFFDSGIPINVSKKNGETPLMSASRNGHCDIVSFLVSKGANVNARKKNNSPLLMEAICHSHDTTELCKILIENGAEINVTNSIGETPLHRACKFKRLEIVRMLINNGADVNAKDKHGNTPLRIAYNSNSFEIIGLLAQNGADIYDQYSRISSGWTNTIIGKSIAAMQIDKLIKLLSNPANANRVHGSGITPLMMAYYNYMSAVLSNKLKEKDKLKEKEKYFLIMNILISKGANVNVEYTIRGKLDWLRQDSISREMAIENLTGHSADKVPNTTLLGRAIIDNQLEAVTLFLAAGAKVTKADLELMISPFNIHLGGGPSSAIMKLVNESARKEHSL